MIKQWKMCCAHELTIKTIIKDTFPLFIAAGKWQNNAIILLYWQDLFMFIDVMFYVSMQDYIIKA